MRTCIVGMGILLYFFSGCGKESDPGESFYAGQQDVLLSIRTELPVDSAQVLFFIKRAMTDSLVYREIVYGISTQVRPFKFTLPAGYYSMVIWGNVGNEHLLVQGDRSKSDISIEYGGGEEPPVIYYGTQDVNVGTDKNVFSGFVLVTSLVELTVKNVPPGIDRLEVTLLNTGAGVYSTTHYIGRLTDPPIVKIVNGVQTDSSYIIPISCFPTVDSLGLSVLDVKGYNQSDQLKYSGRSAPFRAQSRRKLLISCSFLQLKGEVELFMDTRMKDRL